MDECELMLLKIVHTIFTKRQNFRLKTFAEYKINVPEKQKFDRIENIAGKGEKANHQHF